MYKLARYITKRFLIICNAGLSMVMLLLYILPFANQQHTWLINLVALLLPFLLILQLCFLVFWLFAKRKIVFIPLITLLLCWGLTRSLIGFHLPVKKKITEQKDLRVTTWNTHLFNFYENNGTLDAGMLKKANELNADVLAVQEFVFSLDSSSPISLERVKKKLGFRYVVAANDRAFGVHTNYKQKNERYHPFCVAIFSNYPILQWKKVQGLKEYNHTFLWADILVHTDTIRIFNIHLQSMHFGRNEYAFIENIDQQDMDKVQAGSKNIIRKMRSAYLLRASQATAVKVEVEKSPHPVIVCGDMNDVPNSYAYQTICKNLNDSYIEKGWGIGRTFRFLWPTLRIDYILHSKSLSVKEVQIVRPSASDHNPVMADFRIPEN